MNVVAVTTPEILTLSRLVCPSTFNPSSSVVPSTSKLPEMSTLELA